MQQTTLMVLQNGLIAKALDDLSKPAASIPFAVKPEADRLVKDLAGHPHAFVIACVMDRVIEAEQAWGIPYELQLRLGSFELPFLLKLSEQDLEQAMKQPTSLHWLNNVMPKNMYRAIHRISDQYDGDARAIWAGRPPSATVVGRFLEFDGIGPKIASTAVNILTRDLHVEFANRSGIDIGADTQVRRVLSRMGFVPEDASNEDIIERARGMYPEYPGVFDLVLWDTGRSVCRPKDPACARCEWAAQCAYAKANHASWA